MFEAEITEFCCRLFKELLHDIRSGSCYAFFLTDLSGKVINTTSNRSTLPGLLEPGAHWDERTIGRNAIELAMKIREVCICTPECHTNEELSDYFTIAAPILAHKDTGFLGLLSDDLNSVHHAKLLLQASLHSIRAQVKMLAALKDLEVKNRIEKEIIQSINDGILVLNPDCSIAHVNEVGARLIGSSKEELVGKNLRDYVLSELQVAKVFRTGEAIVHKEMFIKLRHKTVQILKNAVPVIGDDGSVIAVIDTFKEIEGVRNLVNQMVGAKASFSFSDIVYKSDKMAETIEIAKLLAKNSLAVLIQGESGTGKELFAHAIHNASQRKNGPFIVIDCAALPRDLVESELFGYVEGAFTGARKGGRPGKFELANGGTVFLDEIGEMPLETQAKFLRVLQSHKISRVGGNNSISVDIRIIAATNRNLLEEVKRRNFREDLYYRLNVATLTIPPLRERTKDILPLADFYLIKYKERLDKPSLEFHSSMLNLLEDYEWPGNVRELENAIARAANLCECDTISLRHFSLSSAQYRTHTAHDNHTTFETLRLEQLEKESIVKALKSHNGNKAKAANTLGIARSTLYNKLQYFKLN